MACATLIILGAFWGMYLSSLPYECPEGTHYIEKVDGFHRSKGCEAH